MCGIIGYIGNGSVIDVLLRGLARLEYRGYDSAGLTVLEKKLTTVKAVGKISNLKEKIKKQHFKDISIGIAHTRWATNGEPNETNAHPHTSNDNTISVIHNGIIENKEVLREELIKKGFTFKTDTDTEVIPVLIEHYLKHSKDFEEALIKTTMKLKGAYGIVAMHEGEEKLYCAKLGSPLCIGISNNTRFVASEPSAFVEHTNKVINLDDHEIAIVHSKGETIKKIKPANGEAISAKKTVVEVPFDIEDVKKGKYAHFMLKEIHEQPQAIQNTIGGKIRNIDNIQIEIPSPLQSVNFLACGTSWHAGLIGEYIIENYVGTPVDVEYASEYINKKCLLSKQDVAIAISQSGETADTREALKKAIAKKASIAGIVNVVGSQIARLAGKGMYLHAGPEIGVASTKAFTCQVAALNLLSAKLSNDQAYRKKITSSLKKVPAAIKLLLDDDAFHNTIKKIANTFSEANNALYLGRGIDFPVALEGALKLKEISYIHAEGYPAGEMKHGPIALIDENMPVFFVVGTGKGNYEKVLSNMEEVKSRKGRIITISDHKDKQIEKLSEFTIYVPHIADTVSPIIKALPLQLIAYHIAVNKGLDPDKPRNLAKSVTVE